MGAGAGKDRGDLTGLTDAIEKVGDKLEALEKLGEKFGDTTKASGRSLEKLVELSTKKSPEIDWTAKRTYSRWVYEISGAKTPLEQVGLYTTVLGGFIYAGSYWRRSLHLVKAAQIPAGTEEYEVQRALAWASDSQVRSAVAFAKMFKRRGLIVGIGAPVLWLAYISSNNN